MLEHSPVANMPSVVADDGDAGSRALLELHVAELRQLFNAMDPAPFRERDLDPKAVAYILDWGQETRAGQPLGLVVHLGRESVTAENTSMLREAIHTYFQLRAAATRRQLRKLFRVGRVSLLIGLAFLAVAIGLGEFVASLVNKENYASIIKESFVIGGWVALWRPLEIFLYDWWPIRAEAKLHDRLSEMDVRLTGDAMATQATP
jgi:hypothetical protein